MPTFPLRINNGLYTAAGELDLPNGFLIDARGIYFKYDDVGRTWKVPGRAQVGAAPGWAAPVDLTFLQFDTGAGSKLLALADNKLYTAAVAAVIAGWTSAKDKQAVPVEFTRAGSFLDAIHDGQDRWLVWSGADEPVLVCDSSTRWRQLGVNKPAVAPTLAKVGSAATITRALANGTGTWANPGNAWDTSTSTAASGLCSSSVNPAQIWSWAGAAGNISNHFLTVRVGSSSLPPYGDGGGSTGSGTGGGGTGTESIVGGVTLEYSTDSGSTWTKFFDKKITITVQDATVSLAAANGQPLANVRVRATAYYTSGTGSFHGNVYDTYLNTSGASAALITSGTYYYAFTEEYAGPDGITVESAWSDVASITVTNPADACYGISVTLPQASVNTQAMGFDTSLINFNIYRSTATGVPPALGYRTALNKAAWSGGTPQWTDPFTGDASILPAKVLDIVAVGDSYIRRNGTPPSFRDATLYQGAIVAIPANDPYRLQWSMPQYPEYWPLPVHDIILTGTERNDELKGVVTLNNSLVVFTESQAIRVKNLPFAGGSSFDLSATTREILAANSGLVGSPRAYEFFTTPAGRQVVAWVSHAGVYMTDGVFRHEWGMGVVRLTAHLDWEQTVDLNSLSSAKLDYDPQKQLLHFNFLDTNGVWQSFWFHISPMHWFKGPDAGQLIPKVTGTHRVSQVNGGLRMVSRACGEISGGFEQFSLFSDGRIFQELTGVTDAAQLFNPHGDIETFARTGRFYLKGVAPEAIVQIARISFQHSDWGPAAQCEWEIELRNDQSGVSQVVRKSGVSLRGARVTSLWVSRAGHSVRVTFKHTGPHFGGLDTIFLDGDGFGGEYAKSSSGSGDEGNS